MSRYELHWNPREALGEVLHTLRLSGMFYCRSELSDPWGLTMPAAPGCLWFHCVLSGTCELAADDFGPVTLTPGAFALVSRGEGHVLRTAPGIGTPNVLDLPHEMASDQYALLRYGGGGAVCILICGIVRLQHQIALDLAPLFPPVIHLDSFGPPQSDWMRSTLKLMAVEARQQSTGGETIVTRLADILVIQAIRSWLENDPAAKTGWLGALQDRQIGRSLAAIHREPENDWTVRSLAAAAAMSRSAFAARFAALVGRPPLRYLTDVRMREASKLLTAEKQLTVGELAGRLGYRSEAAFNRAFKRSNGITPGALRRAASSSEEFLSLRQC